jgi:nucleotide-binding universal stress UspA family protein
MHTTLDYASLTTPATGGRGRSAEPDRRTSPAPIVAAIEPSTASATALAASRLARELGAPLVFVYVRPRMPAFLGHPNYQRRLTRELNRGRRALDLALAAAAEAGVMAHGEIVEGDASRRILEFAAGRRARLVVLGSRRAGSGVSREVLRSATIPVVLQPPAVLDPREPS